MFYPKATFFTEESSCANILTTSVLSLLCLLLLTGTHCWREKALGVFVCYLVSLFAYLFSFIPHYRHT